MVRKQLREKSAKSSWRGGALRVVKKVPISKTEPTPLNPAKLSRYWLLFAIWLGSGQRKRLINKTHVIAKKSLAVLSLLKGKDNQKRMEYIWSRFIPCRKVMEQLSSEQPDNQALKDIIKEPVEKKQVCGKVWIGSRTSRRGLRNRSRNETECYWTKCSVFRFGLGWVFIVVRSFQWACERRSLQGSSPISGSSQCNTVVLFCIFTCVCFKWMRKGPLTLMNSRNMPLSTPFVLMG